MCVQEPSSRNEPGVRGDQARNCILHLHLTEKSCSQLGVVIRILDNVLPPSEAAVAEEASDAEGEEGEEDEEAIQPSTPELNDEATETLTLIEALEASGADASWTKGARIWAWTAAL